MGIPFLSCSHNIPPSLRAASTERAIRRCRRRRVVVVRLSASSCCTSRRLASCYCVWPNPLVRHRPRNCWTFRTPGGALVKKKVWGGGGGVVVVLVLVQRQRKQTSRLVRRLVGYHREKRLYVFTGRHLCPGRCTERRGKRRGREQRPLRSQQTRRARSTRQKRG